MTVAQRWRQFLTYRNLIGGDRQHECPEGIFRGPIKSIAVQGRQLIVVSHWVAHMEVNEQGLPVGAHWNNVTEPGVLHAMYNLDDDLMSPPRTTESGQVHFTYGSVVVTIFPNGGTRLDPRKVHGL